MANAVLLTLGGVAIAVAAYWVGGLITAPRLKAEHADESMRDQERWHRELSASSSSAVRRAYERAAEAVAMWPDRIDRRPKLLAHLKALGDPVAIVVPSGPWSAPVPPVVLRKVRYQGPPGVASATVSTPEHEEELDHVESYRQEGLL